MSALESADWSSMAVLDAAVALLWREKTNTADMARILHTPECLIAGRLARIRDQALEARAPA